MFKLQGEKRMKNYDFWGENWFQKNYDFWGENWFQMLIIGIAVILTAEMIYIMACLLCFYLSN
jgi:hypothetical protein